MRIHIVGAGVIGLFSAYYLQKEGHEIHIFDKGELSDGCSYGNAGMITPSHFIPLAAPGVVTQGIRWMFRSTSPFYIRPRFDWALLNWLWKFYRSCNERQAKAAMPVLLDFNLWGKKGYVDFARETGLDFRLEQQGILMLYQTAKKEREEKETAELAGKLGLKTTILDAREVGAFETGTKVRALGGVYYPEDAHLYPNTLMDHLITLLKTAGVQFHGGREVTGFQKKGNRITGILCGNEPFESDLTILAGGSWSAHLLRDLGIRLLLQDGKGYSLTLSHPVERPHYATILTEAKVAVTPMGEDLRIGGTLELGGLSPRIHKSRLKGILDSIPRYYPQLKVAMPSEKDTWHGFRPCSPDGLPYIGKLKGFDQLILATGHAMMGLSLAPATGQLVRDLVEGTQIRSDYLSFFDPGRFD